MAQEPTIFHRLFSLQDRTALVTGASGGIGRVIATTLAEAGANVGLSGTRLAELETLRAEIVDKGGQAAVLPADLSDSSASMRLIADAHAALGGLDILVNCAGINRRKPIAMVTEDDFDAITAVNLRSVLFLSQAAHALMREQGGGKIVNVGSITSFDALGDVSVYGATKAAIAQLTKTMAVEWARDNIQVNCIAPGFMMTPLTAGAVWGNEQRRRWLLDRIPAHRPGDPEELAGAVLLLASPASSYMTGHTLVVDGGYLIGGWWEQHAQ
jgi:NAD(P)-dependent dehydrogenase (short-subunit alcohol dehydrogenase family)